MQPNNKHLSKHTTTGISFIEILVVLLLMSTLATFVIPRFMSNPKGLAKKQFFSEFSLTLSDTLYQAVTSKKIHQIFFDLDNHEIIVKAQQISPEETDKHKQFKTIPPTLFHSSIKIPERFTINNFYINGADKMSRGETTHDIWFYIMPDGTSQAVIINFQDEEELNNNTFSITINPFYSQAKLHDTFTNP